MSNDDSTRDAFTTHLLELQGRLLALRGVTGTLADLAGEVHSPSQEEEDRQSLFCWLRDEIERARGNLEQLELAHRREALGAKVAA